MTIQGIIREAYFDCLKLAEKHQSGWSCLLSLAFDAAKEGERRHRKSSPGKWRISVDDAARYFAVKWFLDSTKGPENWAAACMLRDDARLALGARDLCPKAEIRKLRKFHAACLALDYSEQMAPVRP